MGRGGRHFYSTENALYLAKEGMPERLLRL